jgi:hypothetical protein
MLSRRGITSTPNQTKMSHHAKTDFVHFTKQQLDNGLSLHRLSTDSPSQLADAFRSGAEWAAGNIAEHNQQLATDAARYRKLLCWMSTNVPEGWEVVCQVGAVAAWMGHPDADQFLDSLEEANVGLAETHPVV